MTRTTLASLHDAPAAGFDEPFEMMKSCHERVHRTLGLLRRLAAHLQVHGADPSAVSAAGDVLRYFDRASPAHHEDEERHVLPWLRSHGLAALADRLHDDHRRMAQAWTAVRDDLCQVAAGAWPADLAGPATDRWERFAHLYEVHIVIEEQEAYPPVVAALAAGELAAVGAEMAARRGVVRAADRS
jgi:hemerythrin-like domain-containing protein